MFNYNDFTLRNAGYLSTDLQDRLRHVSLLIAGCGVGSVFAEVAVRLGCENITLIDADTVAAHNLNRQNFTDADIGKLKVQVLAQRLRAINPQANIVEMPIFINAANVADMVAKSDIVFDTIDFIDLPAIIALHDQAKHQKKPVLSGMNVGWGAALIYFPPDGTYSFRDLFNLPATGSVAAYSYTDKFNHLIEKSDHFLPDEVKHSINLRLKDMADGIPCPMPQLAVAAHCLAGLAGTALVRLLANLPIVAAPQLIYSDMGMLCATSEFRFKM